jgi:hypothetical protein
VRDYHGYDGEYVNRKDLIIDPERFHKIDLEKQNVIDAKSDLALCIEVGEHIPERRARHLINILVNLAPVVLFSAALPGQGGTHHVNEQWPSFWQALFSQHNYLRIDTIRPKIWLNNNIEWWYKQNLVLYANKDYVYNNHHLKNEYDLTSGDTYELVNRQVIDAVASRSTFSGTLRSLPNAFFKAVMRRLYP